MMGDKYHDDSVSEGCIKQKLASLSVARISTVPFFVSTQLKDQINFIASNGASVVVVTSDGPELTAIKWVNGVSHLVVDIPRAISPARDFFGLLKLLYLFKCRRFDIVHSTTPKAGFLTAIASFLCKVPIRLHTFTGQPWVEMHGIKRWLALGSDRIIGILNTHCYADSASQRNFLIEMRLIKPDKISVIGAGSLAGVDITRFNPSRIICGERDSLRQKLGIPKGGLIILFIGRITVDKGIAELLEAFKAIEATIKNVHLLLVGPLDSESGASESVGLSGQQETPGLHVIGHTDIPELYLSIADVLCLPSYREGFGTVIIEAAAMGIPSVGSKIYGITDAIEDGVTGLLVAPKNVEALADALLKLLDSKRLRKKMGDAARYRVLEKFDSKIINEKIVDEYCKRVRKLNL